TFILGLHNTPCWQRTLKSDYGGPHLLHLSFSASPSLHTSPSLPSLSLSLTIPLSFPLYLPLFLTLSLGPPPLSVHLCPLSPFLSMSVFTLPLSLSVPLYSPSLSLSISALFLSLSLSLSLSLPLILSNIRSD